MQQDGFDIAYVVLIGEPMTRGAEKGGVNIVFCSYSVLGHSGHFEEDK
jgi:hypothetical protein